jgi:tetratricopeptide (TPR) repeat protein
MYDEAEEDTEYDYKGHANNLKDQGNEAFQLGTNEGIQKAILLYSQAIDLDPDNHVFYSNRSAAYLKADSKSKALWDAEKCVELAPSWIKGLQRLGAAQQSLKRFPAAIDTFKKALEMDPDNKALWSALRSCQEAFENDKKSRFATAAAERAAEEAQMKLRDEARERQIAAKKKEEVDPSMDTILSGFFSEIGQSGLSEESKAESKAPAGDDDELAGFFSEISGKDKKSSVGGQNSEATSDMDKLITAKYTTQDLGDAKEQFARLTGPNYKWKNLNPYHVLQLDIDATDEDIKYRYKKLSTKVHT